MLLITSVVQAESFVVSDIRIEGLRRIAPGTVFNQLPVAVGETMDSDDTPDIIRRLYRTGFFKNVSVSVDSNVLIVTVEERPAISSIDITGNKLLEKDQLLKGLADIGLAEGRVFNRSVLEKISQELQRQYYSLGHYSVKLDTEVTPLERNRVDININISEGKTALIKKINIIGNKTFEDDELLEDFKSGVPGTFDFFSDLDKYSRQKLSADLETLRSFYLDRGYINFDVKSTQVTITPDKKDIYITINIDEGDVYTIRDIKLAGKIILDKEDYFPQIQLRRGDVFSRKKVVKSAERIDELLGIRGYAFANVNSIPDVNEEDKTVAVTYFVDPGKRVYVRRVNISGNSSSRDEVLRREIRQQESAWFSNDNVKLSRQRLNRLGYFETVNVETPAVPGSTDEVDVNIKVKEKPSGNFLAGLGFSQSDGLIFNTSISENNFMGTGKQVTLGLNTSSANTLYSLAYTNPYWTVNGVSRGFRLSYSKTDFAEQDTADYRRDIGLFGMNFGIPLNEFDRFGITTDIENIKLKLGNDPSDEVLDFFNTEGDKFLNFKLGLSLTHDSRDTAIFPSEGALQSFRAIVTIPGSDLTYYKLSYKGRYYLKLNQTFTLATKADIGYGDGFGDTTRLPIYEHFYAGGFTTVRGWKSNSLGPRDSQGDPIGGNLKVTGKLELIFPPPTKAGATTIRLAGFLDVGNVFDLEKSDFAADELRYSTGLAMTWLSPVGILGISYAFPVNKKDGDETEPFQFTFGTTF